MFVSTLYPALLSIMALKASCLGTPESNQSPEQSLKTRSSDERVFLAYCYYGYPGSEMLYYKNDAESFTGQQPDDIAFIGENLVITPFEGRTIKGKFVSGGSFTSAIAAGAETLADFQFAGTGYNDYHTFNCYKDDTRELFSALWGSYTQVCYSKYYCEKVCESTPTHDPDL